MPVGYAESSIFRFIICIVSFKRHPPLRRKLLQTICRTISKYSCFLWDLQNAVPEFSIILR